jgi:hypothetical protein
VIGEKLPNFKKKTPPYGEVFVIFGYFSLYLGVKLWYVSRPGEIYTHIPDMHRAGVLNLTL